MRAFFLALALFLTACATAASPVREPVEITRTEVRDNGLFAAYIRPAGSGRVPGIVVIGGSEGGIAGAESLARPLAEQGYATLALAYFNAEGLPPNVQEIPLQYFDRAIDWLKARPDVDAHRIALVGGSKGGEAVLLIGARRRDLAAVVAGAPSDVAWQGINRDSLEAHSSWSDENGPVPFTPYDSAPFSSVYRLYEGGRAAYGDSGEALIHVERLSAPLLLLAGANDGLWPSADMTNRILARLHAAHFRYRVESAIFPNAGHGVIGRAVTMEQAERLNALGGATEGNFAARQQGWDMTLRFLDRTLRR